MELAPWWHSQGCQVSNKWCNLLCHDELHCQQQYLRGPCIVSLIYFLHKTTFNCNAYVDSIPVMANVRSLGERG